MYYAAQQMTMARQIARSASRQIKGKTGMQATIMLYPVENALKTPQQMLHVIATTLGMDPGNYRMKKRTREIVELRFIAAMLLRNNFSELTLSQIASLFGGQDHSSIINGLARAYNLIHTRDLHFIHKYNMALNAVNLWLRGAQ